MGSFHSPFAQEKKMEKIIKNKLKFGFKNNVFETATGWNNHEVETTLTKEWDLFTVMVHKNGQRKKVFKTFESALDMFLTNVDQTWRSVELSFFESTFVFHLETINHVDKKDILNLEDFLNIK